jgi:hypothetical protein
MERGSSLGGALRVDCACGVIAVLCLVFASKHPPFPAGSLITMYGSRRHRQQVSQCTVSNPGCCSLRALDRLDGPSRRNSKPPTPKSPRPLQPHSSGVCVAGTVPWLSRVVQLRKVDVHVAREEYTCTTVRTRRIEYPRYSRFKIYTFVVVVFTALPRGRMNTMT